MHIHEVNTVHTTGIMHVDGTVIGRRVPQREYELLTEIVIYRTMHMHEVHTMNAHCLHVDGHPIRCSKSLFILRVILEHFLVSNLSILGTVVKCVDCSRIRVRVIIIHSVLGLVPCHAI